VVDFPDAQKEDFPTVMSIPDVGFRVARSVRQQAHSERLAREKQARHQQRIAAAEATRHEHVMNQSAIIHAQVSKYERKMGERLWTDEKVIDPEIVQEKGIMRPPL
jgi:hypothetical protein